MTAQWGVQAFPVVGDECTRELFLAEQRRIAEEQMNKTYDRESGRFDVAPLTTIKLVGSYPHLLVYYGVMNEYTL